MVSLNDRFTWEEIVEIILEKNDELKNKKFRKWLLEKKFVGYHFDYYLWCQAYNIYKKITTTDNDHFTVISGIEGCGKSVLALLLAAVVSSTFSMKFMCFSLEHFFGIINKAKKGDTILLDEGAMFLFSREAMTKDNRRVVKTFNLMRQLNLHIIVCIPNFNNIDTYIREHRVDTLLQVRKSRDTYKGIIKEGIRVINDNIKKIKNINAIKIPHGTFWNGYWTKKYPEINDINEKEYRKKKREHLTAFINEMKKQAKYEEELVVSMVKVSEFAKLVPMGNEAIIRNIMKGRIPGRKIGNIWYVDGKYHREIRDIGGKKGLNHNNSKGNENHGGLE